MAAVPLDGSVALVTGAGRGLGQAVAIALARLGAHVVATSHTQGGLEETDDAIRATGGTATLLPLDLREGEAIDAIGPSLHQRFGRLDILVHCAAVLGPLTPASHLLIPAWEQTFAVNLNAALRLIRTTDPLLRAADAGRAVFIADRDLATPHAYWAAYGASKAAQTHLVLAWAAELRLTRLRVNLLEAPPMATRLRRQAFPGEDTAPLASRETIAKEAAKLCLPSEARHGEIVGV
jgi:NAD(P)-dependent dehydrogenase (short-subunit alcohol dehydrogenase family)